MANEVPENVEEADLSAAVAVMPRNGIMESKCNSPTDLFFGGIYIFLMIFGWYPLFLFFGSILKFWRALLNL